VLTAIQFRAEQRTILTRRFEQRPSTCNSSIHAVISFLAEDALGFLTKDALGFLSLGGYTGGVGSRPPRASFLGVRSLSLLFADFVTLLLFVFIFVLCSFFVPRCNHRWLWQDQDSCQGCEISKVGVNTGGYSGFTCNRNSVTPDLVDRLLRNKGETSDVAFILLWLIFEPPRLQFCTHV
jgi:hypothetical protein